MNKKSLSSKRLFVSFVFFIIIALLTSFWIFTRKQNNSPAGTNISNGEVNDDLPVFRLSASTIIDTDSLNELVGDADYVFAAKVVSQDGYEYKNPVKIETEDGGEREVSDPHTKYSVRILENIKGDLISDADIPLLKDGGLYKDGSGYAIYEDDELPNVGDNYIFYVYAQSDGSLLVAGPNSNEKIDMPKSVRTSNVKEIVQVSEEVAEVKAAFKKQVIRKGRGEFGGSNYEEN